MALGLRIVVDRWVWSFGFYGFFFFFFFDRCLKEEVGMAKLGMAFCYWFDLILGWILFVGSWWWSWGLPWFGLILILWVAVVVAVGGCHGLV